MCPEGTTNLEDGAAACQIAIAPGTNLATRYAVIVSFGVLLNGTSLEDVAPKVWHQKIKSLVFLCGLKPPRRLYIMLVP